MLAVICEKKKNYNSQLLQMLTVNLQNQNLPFVAKLEASFVNCSTSCLSSAVVFETPAVLTEEVAADTPAVSAAAAAVRVEGTGVEAEVLEAATL